MKLALLQSLDLNVFSKNYRSVIKVYFSFVILIFIYLAEHRHQILIG